MRLLTLHRVLSGLSLILVVLRYSGIVLPTPVYYTVWGPTLALYVFESVTMTVTALLNVKRFDVVLPIVTLVLSLLAIKSLVELSNLETIYAVVLIMFMLGYSAGGEHEGGGIRKDKQG